MAFQNCEPESFFNNNYDSKKEINNLYEAIIEKVERYNKLNNEDKITLNIEKKYSISHVYLFVYKEKFIGVIDLNKGVFNKDNYGYFYFMDDNYNFGINDNSMLKPYKVELSKLKRDFNINTAISFSQMREIMKNSYPELDTNYDIYKATEKEILDVINFSFTYFQFSSKIKKRYGNI